MEIKDLEKRIAYLEAESEGVYNPYPADSPEYKQYEILVKNQRKSLLDLNYSVKP